MKISNTEHCFFCFNNYTNSFFKLKMEENGGGEGVDCGEESGGAKCVGRRREKRRVRRGCVLLVTKMMCLLSLISTIQILATCLSSVKF